MRPKREADRRRAHQAKIGDAVNSLLVVGFYLINLGYVTLALQVADDIAGPADAIEALSVKIGAVLLVLGAMHFLNLLVFSRIRRSKQLEYSSAPPAGPSYWTPPAAPGAPARPDAGEIRRPERRRSPGLSVKPPRAARRARAVASTPGR